MKNRRLVEMKKVKALRGVFAVTAAAATLLAGADTRADQRDGERCASSAYDGQASRDEGAYRRARELFLECSRDVCPTHIKRDCLDWLAQLESIAPTVVFAAKDGARDVTDVKVFVDDALVLERLDGKPMAMDVGEHKVRFEYAGQSRSETVVIGAGQKGRNIVASFNDAAPPPSPGPAASSGERRSESGSLVPSAIAGGVGVLALGSFAFFGLTGMGDVDDLKQCRPNCATGDVDSTRTKLLVADVSLGVGIVALGVATYLFFTRPKIDVEAPTASTSQAKRSLLERVTLDFAPTHGGAAGSIGAAF